MEEQENEEIKNEPEAGDRIVEEQVIPQEIENRDPAIQEILDISEKVKKQLARIIIGQTELIDLLIMAMLTRGHILIEGVPGIAKTLTAKLFARTIDGEFSRIQFTPDLMPSDILGTNVFNAKTQNFDFKSGPIFADIIVVDEINRAPAKTQAAMFEVMQEAQVSIDGVTRKMGDGFMVIATQNPIDHEGTYTLPEAQLDRFLFKINLTYPSPEEEVQVLQRFEMDFDMRESNLLETVVHINDLVGLRSVVEKVTIEEDLLKYIAEIIQETRMTGDLYLGASTRASIWLMKASKAAAALAGRSFVTPDDIRRVTSHVLNHRIILSPQREMEGISTSHVLEQIIKKVEVPR
jgi:MoxR-like ATPase